MVDGNQKFQHTRKQWWKEEENCIYSFELHMGKKAKPSQISVSFWWSLKGWGWCSCNYFCQSTGWRPGYLPPARLGAAHPHAGIKYESHINYKPTKHSFGGCGNFFSPLFQVPMFFSKKFRGKSAPQDLALVQRGRHLIPSPLFWQKTAC